MVIFAMFTIENHYFCKMSIDGVLFPPKTSWEKIKTSPANAEKYPQKFQADYPMLLNNQISLVCHLFRRIRSVCGSTRYLICLAIQNELTDDFTSFIFGMVSQAELEPVALHP